MSIATEIIRLQTAKANLKTSIEAKGVTVSSEATLDEYPALVNDIPSGGGGPVEEKTVNFIDFDGTIVASYTGVEAQALTELPSAPDHTSDTPSLTFDEWNWTLADIKAYNTSYPDAKIWVGAIYHPTDDKTHLFFDITTDYDGYGVKIRTVSYGGTVDWGDESAVESFSAGDVTHVYTSAGNYHCVIDSMATSIGFNGVSVYASKVQRCYLSSYITGGSLNFSACNSLVCVTLPRGVTSLAAGVFNGCTQLHCLNIPSSVTSVPYIMASYSGLATVCVPSTLTSFGDQIFSNCKSLQKITIPSGVTSLPSEMFGESSIMSVTIPNSVTSLKYKCFYSCKSIRSMPLPNGLASFESDVFYQDNSLQSVTIPSTVTSIGSRCFASCYSLYTVIVEATTPPTLSNSNAFSLDYQKKIYVPAGSVETYKTETNWSTFASIIEAIPS